MDNPWDTCASCPRAVDGLTVAAAADDVQRVRTVASVAPDDDADDADGSILALQDGEPHHPHRAVTV